VGTTERRYEHRSSGDRWTKHLCRFSKVKRIPQGSRCQLSLAQLQCVCGMWAARSIYFIPLPLSWWNLGDEHGVFNNEAGGV
jgi:hypothetical protein